MKFCLLEISALTIRTLLASSVTLLAACGGGGGGIDGAIWTTSGTVLDASGKPVIGAVVELTLDRTYSTTTDSSGAYKLKTPQEYSYPAYFAGTVTKDGYIPKPILFTYLNSQLGANSKITTRNTTDADVIFKSGIGVTHLGDDNFGGSANSQLQMPSSGAFWSDQFLYTAELKNKYNKICIEFLGKGFERSNDTNKNLISISQNSQPGTYQSMELPDSSSNGSYSPFTQCFSLARFPADSIVAIQINSGLQGSDYDDFEFVNVLGRLQGSGVESSSSTEMTGSMRTVSIRNNASSALAVDYQKSATFQQLPAEIQTRALTGASIYAATMFFPTPPTVEDFFVPTAFVGSRVYCEGFEQSWQDQLSRINDATMVYGGLSTAGITLSIYDMGAPQIRISWNGDRPADWSLLKGLALQSYQVQKYNLGCP